MHTAPTCAVQDAAGCPHQQSTDTSDGASGLSQGHRLGQARDNHPEDQQRATGHP